MLKHLCLYKTAILLFWSICCFSQGKFSPSVASSKTFIEVGKTVLSINVSSVSEFEKRYQGKIKILRRNDIYKSFEVQLLQETVIQELANDVNIIFIDKHEKVKTEADFEFSNYSFNRITKVQQLLPASTGLGSKISVKELSFDPANVDLVNRSFATSLSPSSTSQHATNMAILLAGAGNSSYRTKGVAPQATITASDFNNLFPDPIAIFSANNIQVQNHSYGIGIENYYGSEAVAYDQQVYQNPSLLHIFSAGNSGSLKPTSGTYQNMSFANLTGNFKQAKNVLIVNAVDSTLKINSLNSRGPAYDGRIKPELTAFGQGGTSDAAALVSGISTLIYEKFTQKQLPAPDASMVKAILVASSEDVGTPGPDYLYGYGSVDAYDALQLVEANQFTSVTVQANSLITYPITFPPSASELRVAVAWTDVQASINMPSALVNDVDSWIDDGTIVRPWVLSSFPKTDSLLAIAKRREDHLNNLEYITIASPTPGTVQLRLRAGNLNSGFQKVSVAYWFAAKQIFSWDYPQLNEQVEGGNKNLLLWKATKGKTGDLYLQLNQGNWQLVESALNLDNYVYWNTPDTLSTGKLRMVIEGETFTSGEFVISPLVNLKTAFICNDQVGLSWKKVNGATGYEVYTMGSQYQKKIVSLADTVYTFTTANDRYFAVTPILNSQPALKSELIDYTSQGAFCYINFFNAERIGATRIKLRLLLSSILKIESITLYRTVNGRRDQWKQLTSLNALTYEFLDADFPSGNLEYQVEISLQDKTKILSDVVQVIVEEKGKLLLYPNPVSVNEDLNILSQGEGSRFHVFDLLGKLVFEIELQKTTEAVDVISLPAGLYLYKLLSPSGQVKDAGRFIKK